jgi:hypothetical protein
MISSSLASIPIKNEPSSWRAAMSSTSSGAGSGFRHTTPMVPARAPAQDGRNGLRCGGLGGFRLLEDELAVPVVDPDRVAFDELAFEQPQRQRVLD